MKNILVSGLVNVETTVPVRKFPVEYYPIDYPFFGISTAVSGVGYNITAALTTLGDKVMLCGMVGDDFQGEYIRRSLARLQVDTGGLRTALCQTPSSAILYDPQGKRQVYCDLKDIQETSYGFSGDTCRDADLVVACNINFNRPLLAAAKAANKTVATDVHVLSDIHDDYNRDFMAAANILFLSDEGVGENYAPFLRGLAQTYHNEIIVLGRGGKGAALWKNRDGSILELPSVQVGEIVNTVGAGDALFSGFLHHYAAGCTPEEALIRAQIFASAKIRASGGAKGFISEEIIEAFYSQFAQQMKRSAVYR